MKKLNYTQINEQIIKSLKNYVPTKLKINVYRAIKEFFIKHRDEIYKYKNLFFVGDKWVYDINDPQEIQPIQKPLFCGWPDSDDDTYHCWLKDKKVFLKYGITYAMYKDFHSLNWFIITENNEKKLYIDNKYWNKI